MPAARHTEQLSNAGGSLTSAQRWPAGDADKDTEHVCITLKRTFYTQCFSNGTAYTGREVGTHAL